MAKKRPSVQKRQREQQKRQREFDKAAKAAQKRERREARRESGGVLPVDDVTVLRGPGDQPAEHVE